MSLRLRPAFAAALVLLAGAAPAGAFQFVSGSESRGGDLVVVWIDGSGSFEYMLNLGSVDDLAPGTLVSPFSVPAEFGGSLEGGRFAALAVRDPQATFPGDETCVQPNIVITANDDPAEQDQIPLYLQSNDARPQLDPGVGLGWLPGLNQIPLPSELVTDVIVNEPAELLVASSQQRSYGSVLAPLNVDNIAGTLSFTTVGAQIPDNCDGCVDEQCDTCEDAPDAGYAIDLYEISTVLDCVDTIPFETTVTYFGTIEGDNGNDGTASIVLNAPEPGSAVAGGLAIAATAAARRLRARISPS